MKAIITAGGKGTRMRPLTFSSNKHFIPLANKPLLFYAIEEVVECGIKEIGINYNPGQLEEIKSYLGTGEKWKVKISYILQEEPKGLANIVQVSRDFIGKDKFVMHLGDNIFYGGIKPLVEHFEKGGANGLLTIIHHPENSRLGVPYFDKKGKLIKLVEKPKNPPNDWAVPGLYFGDCNIFKCFSGKDAIKPSARGEYEIPAVFQWLLDHGFKVETKEFTGVWKDPGKFDDWLETNGFILDMEVKNGYGSKLDESVKIEGRVKVGKGCKIKNSILRGPSVIGDGVQITDSFVGPYSSIGNDCTIDHARIENTILTRNVQVLNPKKNLNVCLVGEGSIIQGNDKETNMQIFVGDKCILTV